MNLEWYRDSVEEMYLSCPTGCGASFGELLCHEIHTQGETFLSLTEKWGISVTLLGLLIADHCARLEPKPYLLPKDNNAT